MSEAFIFDSLAAILLRSHKRLVRQCRTNWDNRYFWGATSRFNRQCRLNLTFHPIQHEPGNPEVES